MWPTERIANAAPRGRERTTAKPVAAIRNPLVDCCCRELYDHSDGPTTRMLHPTCLALRAPRIESIGCCPKRSLGLYADFGAFSGNVGTISQPWLYNSSRCWLQQSLRYAFPPRSLSPLPLPSAL